MLRTVKRELRMLARIGSALLIELCARVTSLLPRDSSLWVFGNAKFFGDNPRYLLDLVRCTRPDISCVWLARTRAQLALAREAGYRAELTYGPKGFWYALRARVGVICGSIRDVNRFCTGGMHVVQLWHGFPMKRILLDYEGEWHSTLPGGIGRLLSAASRWALWRHFAVAQVCAEGAIARDRLRTAFQLPEDRYHVTGVPRDDVLLSRAAAESGAGAFVLADLKGSRVVLYAPTWRAPAEVGAFEQEVSDLLTSDALAALLKNAGAVLLLKPHPYMRFFMRALARAAARPTIRIAEEGAVPDINVLLRSVDVLITDYSSVAFDYALLERPIVFFAPDLDAYTAGRSFYSDFEDYTGGLHCRTAEDLLRALDACLGGAGAPYVDNARRLRRAYRGLADGRSGERILEQISVALDP